jgi:3-hydroxymyristoyl/3-hydroxydecanoyl-(acyl carrier protein) dehydratase
MRHISEYADIFLPIGQMLQIDRVREVTGDRVVCEMDLERSWVFPLHFPGDPIFPGSLIIEGAGQAIAIWAWENELRGDPRLVRVEAEFRRPVVPKDGVLTYVGTIKRKRNVCVGVVSVMCGERQVAQVKGSLVVTSPSEVSEQAPARA